MTKEELEKEAEESFEQYKVTDEDYVVSPYSDDMGEKMLMYNDEYYAEETYLRLYKQGYLAGAEPREKQIAELSKHIVELQKDKGELIDRCRELETRCNELFLQTMQLSKAKEIISKLANLDGAINIPMDKVISLRVKAEQFIKDSEVENV